MNIERLKELKVEFEQMRKHNDRHYMSTITEDDVLEVLDEAIARQSAEDKNVPTSEDVAEAIGLLSGKSYGTHNLSCDCVFCKAIDLAITALQAYEPTTRKDRIVEEVAISKTETTSCKWCDNADEMEVAVKTVFSSGKSVGIKRFSSSKSTFCPNCGRRLD